ncbi:MAG TPA: LuxR C-terminal-related transcriptional regulator [Streptosporangiaceae bacterium]|jgi:LuxR family maltose regulon positive regulatory protein
MSALARSAYPASRRQASSVDDPLLAARITPPDLPRWVVSRQRIEKRIADGARGPLTVITGPPGAGKTIAMASWVAANAGQNPTAWLALDEYDNRPRVFWPYVVEALSRAGLTIPRPVSASARRGHADLGFILRLASAVVAKGEPVSLVLDDFHLLTGHTLMNGLVRLLTNAQPALHLVVASRGDPALPLHRYRLAGALTEIRTDELAFTVGETDLLMAQHGVVLPGNSVEILTERAEGWAAALRLAAISMDGDSDPEQSVKEIAAEDGAVAGYLVEEVLSTQPARIRDLLLKTSILDRVSGDIASELADDKEATSDLPALAEANSFVQPLHHGWYRYHSLFAEVLQLKLRRERPDEVPELHRRAARWFSRNGTLAEATRQAGVAGDWQLAAQIVIDELAVAELIDAVDTLEPLAEVMQGMPPDLPWPRPEPLLVTAALRLFKGRDDADVPLKAAEGILAQLPSDTEVPSRVAAATISLALARRAADLKAAKTAVDEAVRLLGKLPPALLTRRPELRAHLMAGHGYVQLWSGDFNQAAVTFRSVAAETASPRQRTECLGQLALAEAVRGRLSEAAKKAGEAAAASSAGQPGTDYASCAAHVALAYVHLERHEVNDARHNLKQADALLRARPDKLIGAIAGLVAAAGCLAEDRPRQAGEIVIRVRRNCSTTPWLERHLALVESRACLAVGDGQGALAAARRAGAGTFVDATAASARASLASGDAHAANEQLSAVAAGFEQAPEGSRLAARLIEAHLAHLSGERDHASRALAQALALATAEQLRLPFAMEGSWLRSAVEHDQDLAHAYRQFLDQPRTHDGARRAAQPRGRAASALRGVQASGQVAAVVVESLSNRELEVLRYVSQMLGTTEIAAEMYVSVNTVKSHLKSIFRKLGVASRNDAVRTARELKLI